MDGEPGNGDRTNEPEAAEPRGSGAEPARAVPLEEWIGRLEADLERDRAGSAVERGPAAAPRAPARRGASAGRSVLFDLGGTRSALPIDRVFEVGEVPKITPVPNVPRWLAGVVNLRGDVLAVVDLRALVGLSPFDRESRPGRLLVVRSAPGADGEVAAGLWVDAVLGVAELSPSDLAPPEGPLDDALAALVEGVTVRDGRMIAALDLDALLAHPELARLRSEGAPRGSSRARF